METKTELQQEKALRERMRGEKDVSPEDTLPELREDLNTVGLRHQMRDVPGVSPEDTRSELLAERGAAGRTDADEEERRIAAKEERKAAEFAAMRAARAAEAAKWTPEQAAARAGRDVEAYRDERSSLEKDYQLGDMGRNADVNPHYRAALEEAAPDIAASIDARREAARQAEAGAKQTGIPDADLDAQLAAQEVKARGLDPRMPEQDQPGSKSATAAALAAEQEAQVDKALDVQLADDLRQRKAREAAAQGQGENAVNVEKTGKELENGDFIMPRRIVQRYNEVDGKFFTKDAQRPMVMFEDKGNKLATSTTDRQAVEDMVTLAKAKQWESLKLSGSAEFRREAWLQAESQGIRTQGYTPKQADLAALEALREERTKNSIAPIQERKQERQQQQQQAEPTKAAPRHDLNKNQASMHDEATKAIPANIAELRKQPAFANRGDDELQKLAYWRGIVSEDNKGQPQGVKEEALARFDKAAEDPQFLKQLNRETNVQEVTTERVTTRVEVRDMPELSR